LNNTTLNEQPAASKPQKKEMKVNIAPVQLYYSKRMLRQQIFQNRLRRRPVLSISFTIVGTYTKA